MTRRRTARRRTAGLERIVRREFDESRTDVERTKVTMMAALSLTMLQQRWRCSSRNVTVGAALLLRHCWCCGAAIAAHCGAAVAAHCGAAAVAMALRHCG